PLHRSLPPDRVDGPHARGPPQQRAGHRFLPPAWLCAGRAAARLLSGAPGARGCLDHDPDPGGGRRMKPRALLRPGQIAWLAEIGLDTHWLAARPEAGAETPAAADPAAARSQAPAQAGAAPAVAPGAETPPGVPPESRVSTHPGLARVRAPAGL